MHVDDTSSWSTGLEVLKKQADDIAMIRRPQTSDDWLYKDGKFSVAGKEFTLSNRPADVLKA